MKKLICIIALCLTCIGLCGCSSEDKALKPTDAFFINDFADVLSNEQEKKIYDLSVKLQTDTTAQVVVVTVDTIDGETLENYTYDLANDWGIGANATDDNGVLIFLAVKDREFRIEVGSGLDADLATLITEDICDVYAMPCFEKDDFSTGLIKTHNAVVNEVYRAYDMQPVDPDYDPDKIRQENAAEDIGVAGVIIVIIVVAAIVLSIFLSFKGRGGGSGNGGGPGIMFFPFFFGGPRGPRGGGGFGSGGFGGFSGGGGGFSGGGSSRRF